MRQRNPYIHGSKNPVILCFSPGLAGASIVTYQGLNLPGLRAVQGLLGMGFSPRLGLRRSDCFIGLGPSAVGPHPLTQV